MTVEPIAAETAPDHSTQPLLAPIEPGRPSGDSLRNDPMFEQIRRAREEDDPTLPQGVWKRELKRADWPRVAELCSTALATRTKDLTIALWLTEAWLKMRGFAGFAEGIQLTAALCRDFWETMYPPLDPDSRDARLAPLVSAASRLTLPLKSVPLTQPQGDTAVPYAWRDWETSLYLENLAQSNPAAAAAAQERGMVPQAKFLLSASLTPAAFLVSTASELRSTVEALDELRSTLVTLCGEGVAPSVAPLRTPLASMLTFIERMVEERVAKGELSAMSVDASAPSIDGVANVDAASAASVAAAEPSASISGRADAYRKLREAADYLMRTEPHSPVPYLVLRAIAWGNMSLAEVLEELLQKGADLNAVYTFLGIRKP
jgi:type VI secretion system protein ImpA